MVSASTAHTEALKREEAATRSLTEAEAARAKQAMSMRMQPILSTGSSNLPTKATSAFNEPDKPLNYTVSGIESVDKMRAGLAALRVEEAALRAGHAAGNITGQELSRNLERITSQTNLLTAGNARARGAIRQTAAAMASLSFEFLGAAAGASVFGAILTGPAVFGFKLQNDLDQTKNGLATLLISMGLINGEAIKLPKALELAGGMTDKIVADSMKFGLNLKGLQDTTLAIAAVGIGASLTLPQIQDLARAGVQMTKAFALDPTQSPQELRDLVQGGIDKSSAVARALGVNDTMVKQWRSMGKDINGVAVIYTELMKRLSNPEAAVLGTKTLSGAWDVLKLKLQMALINPAIFEELKKNLLELSDWIGKTNEETQKFEFNPELIKLVDEYWRGLKAAAIALKEAAVLTADLLPLIVKLGEAFLLLKTINLMGTIGKSLIELGAAATATTASVAAIDFVGPTQKAKGFQEVLNGFGKNPIVQVIGVEVAWEGGQFVGTQLNKYFGDFFAKELEKINKLIYNFGNNITATLVDALAAVFQWGPISRLLGISEFFSGMADEIRRGGDTAAAAAAAQAKRIAHISAQYDSVQSEGGSRSKGKVGGGSGRLISEEMAMIGGGDVLTAKNPSPPEKDKKGPKGAADPQIAFMAGLRREVRTLGMSEEAIKRYDLSKMELTATNRRLAEAYTATVFKFKAEQEAAKANNEEAQKAIDADNELVKSSQDKVAETEKAIAQLQFETSLLGLNEDARYRAIAANELSANAYTAGNEALIERVALLKKETEQQSRLASLVANTQTAKTQDFMSNVGAADTAFFRGDIGSQQYDEIIKNITDGTNAAKEKISELDQFTEKALKNMQQGLADYFFDPFAEGVDGMLKGFGTMLQRMVADAAAAQVMKSLFGELGGGAAGDSGIAGTALAWLGSLTASANGNAFAGGQVQAFASGGILGSQGGMLNRPTVFPMANGGLGIGGEAGVEAVMPLKRGSDGKLGVAAGGGGGGSTTINVTVQGGQSAPDVRRAAGQGAREALGMLNGARRYG
ncbi:MAG: hypothetical protein B7Z31_00315 [Rhodobacterales bacterium 12-65-15]|nr:MAG: hypothetical protein B7Z31_00315 [Rhodobacterales bacterium 12-65-15]